jgi:hypothetical protein
MSISFQIGGSGVLEAVSQLAVVGGTLVLVLGLVALGAFAYRSLRGDGIEWPSDAEEDADEVRRGGTDDDWKYY